MEQSTKMLGGIAYICIIVFSIFSSFVPFIGILSLIAAICVLVAFIQGGNQVGRPDVKQNIIIGIVLYIVATILFVFVIGAAFAAAFTTSGEGMAALGAGMIVGGIIAWILFIIGAWFWYKASAALGEGSGVGLFKAGGIVIFIGAILTIIGIGFLVMWIGEILQAVAFFSAPEKGVEPADNAA